jgi:hypothetical protein
MRSARNRKRTSIALGVRFRCIHERHVDRLSRVEEKTVGLLKGERHRALCELKATL